MSVLIGVIGVMALVSYLMVTENNVFQEAGKGARLDRATAVAERVGEESALAGFADPGEGWLYTSVLDPGPALTWDTTSFTDDGRREGDLEVLMAPEEREKSPKLKLRVRARLAQSQPAKNGVLILHCGGPGSDRTCLDHLLPSPKRKAPGQPGGLDEELADSFDVFAIDQRGIGLSEPRLSCPNTKYFLPEVGSRMTSMENFTDCPCLITSNQMYTVHNEGEVEWDFVLGQLKAKAKRGEQCYKSPHLVKDKRYNVMNYMGTTYLAHDLDTLRRAVGARKLSLYGISYGTWVGAVYASQYPEYTDRLILDSNLPPIPTIPSFSEDSAANHQQMLTEFVKRCKVAGSQRCKVADDPAGAFNFVIDRLRSGFFTAQSNFGPMELSSDWLAGNMHGMLSDMRVRQVMAAPFMRFGELLHAMRSVPDGAGQMVAESELDRSCAMYGFPLSEKGKCVDKQGKSLAMDVNETLGTFACPTWRQYGFCAGNAPPEEIQNAMMWLGVMASDVPGRFLPHQLVHLLQRLDDDYGVIGKSAAHVLEDVALWPGRSAYTAIGSGRVRPLVIGILHDSATGFKWSAEMKLAFPDAAMMIWQGFHHGMPSAFTLFKDQGFGLYDCQRAMREYLMTGTLPRNGLTCQSRERIV